jgi:hypothetical protein
VLNQVPSHEDIICTRISTAPFSTTRWRWVVSFTPRPFWPRGWAACTHWRGGWRTPEPALEAVAKRTKIPSLPLQGIERSLPARSLLTILTELHGTALQPECFKSINSWSKCSSQDFGKKFDSQLLNAMCLEYTVMIVVLNISSSFS